MRVTYAQQEALQVFGEEGREDIIRSGIRARSQFREEVRRHQTAMEGDFTRMMMGDFHALVPPAPNHAAISLGYALRNIRGDLQELPGDQIE